MYCILDTGQLVFTKNLVRNFFFITITDLDILCFRVYPFLCRAVRNYAKDWGQIPSGKEFYLSLIDVPTKLKYVNCQGLLLPTLNLLCMSTHIHILSFCGSFKCFSCKCCTDLNEIGVEINALFAFVGHIKNDK